MFGGHYLVNQKLVQLPFQVLSITYRLVHSFTAAGVLPSQYKQMRSRCIVCFNLVVIMLFAAGYNRCETRFDCKCIPHHSTLPIRKVCLFIYCIFYFMYNTHKVVGITTLSRADHLTAQTREYHCTCDVLPQVLARGTHMLSCVLCALKNVL